MDKARSTAGVLLAKGQEQIGQLAKHGPAAVKDGIDSYVGRVQASDSGDALSSWNDSSSRDAIIAFVQAVSVPGSPDFVPEAERIAVFDNDGTLWPEKPLVIQIAYILDRFSEMATEDSSLQDKQPYKAAYEKEYGWLSEAVVKHYEGDDADMGLLMQAIPGAYAGWTIEDYLESVKGFFRTAEHPTLGRPFATLGYQPMVELLRYLEANGFTVYIASGGERDFMRAIAMEIYGIPPERVIGSAFKLEFKEHDDGVDVFYQPEMDFFDDGPEKPVRIWSRVGRRPILAGGNANGDMAMLRFANVPSRKSLRLLVNHDDAEREFDYQDGAEDALAQAETHNWTVISMKNDWSQIFTDQAPAELKPTANQKAPTDSR